MYKNADEKYHALASFLKDCGISAEMYPQGSFAFGTVVRPTAKDPHASYDLDFICQLVETRDQIAPSELRHRIEAALKSSDRYAGKLKVYDECFTIEYADVNGISFTIDLVPAADESFSLKQELKSKSDRPDLLETAIAIPQHNGERNYSWLTNNPRGFQQWFEEINDPFLNYNRYSRRQKIYRDNQSFYRSIDDIPVGLERSALQRVIQILKYHRDVYYLKLHGVNGDDVKPISAIINTVVAGIAKSANPQSDVFDLLEYVLRELSIYAKHQFLSRKQFMQSFGTRSIITKSENDGKWMIANPADPEDNLANKWNENPDIPKWFFLWLSVCEQDLIHALSLPDNQFRSAMDNAFGILTTQKSWGDKYKGMRIEPKPITTSPKPYRK